jgi:carbohydrate-binding DOMON domain-containing protein
MIPLLFTDPAGDDYGLGYGYPRAPLFSEAGQGFADLRGFEALRENDKAVLRIRLARYPNPAGAPNGFSFTTVAIYVDTGPGGSTDLPGAGFRVSGGWERAYLITGWKAEERYPNGGRKKLSLRKAGGWLELRPGLPAGNYGYYVTTGIYDPFTSWNFRPIRPGGGPWVLDGPAGAPKAVDVLTPNQSQISAYKSGTLSPTKALENRFPWAILSAAVGLLITLLAFRFR